MVNTVLVVDSDAIVAIGLGMDGVAEAMSCGTSSLKRDGRFMLRLKEDGESIVVKVD